MKRDDAACLDTVETSAESHAVLKYLADTLTLARFLVAALILFVAFTRGATALGLALAMLFAGWLTDCVDGSLARRSGTGRNWVSGIDLYADVSLTFSFFLFLVATGLFPAVSALLIVAALGLVVCLNPSRAVIKIVVSPFFALPIVISFTFGLLAGTCSVAFVAVFFASRWDRVIDETRRTMLEATERATGD